MRWMLLLLLFSSSLSLFSQVNTEYFMTVRRNELSKGNDADTINKFNTVVRFDKGNFEAYFLRGIAKYNLGDFIGAENDFSRTLELHPLFVVADYRAAIADYTRSIELFPDFAGAYLNRSEAKKSLKDEKGAYKDYQKAIEIIDAVKTYGYDSLTVKQFADSAYFNKIMEFEADFVAVKLDNVTPDKSVDLELAFMVQFALEDQMIFDQSRTGYAFHELKELNEKNTGGVQFVISNDHVELGLEQAYQRLILTDSMLSHDPSSAQAYFLKGVINSMVQNYNTALQDYEKSLQLDTEQPLAYLNRGYVLFEMAEREFVENKFSGPVTITWEGAEKETLTLIFLNDTRSACRDLSQAGELGLEQAYRVIKQYCNTP